MLVRKHPDLNSPEFINTQIEHYRLGISILTAENKMYTQEYFFVSNQLKYWQKELKALNTPEVICKQVKQ